MLTCVIFPLSVFTAEFVCQKLTSKLVYILRVPGRKSSLHRFITIFIRTTFLLICQRADEGKEWVWAVQWLGDYSCLLASKFRLQQRFSCLPNKSNLKLIQYFLFESISISQIRHPTLSSSQESLKEILFTTRARIEPAILCYFKGFQMLFIHIPFIARSDYT